MKIIAGAIKRELIENMTLTVKIIHALLEQKFLVLIIPTLRFGKVMRKQ
jgi:hypothetical protein